MDLFEPVISMLAGLKLRDENTESDIINFPNATYRCKTDSHKSSQYCFIGEKYGKAMFKR